MSLDSNNDKKPEDLKNIKGIGDKLFDKIKDKVKVGNPSKK